MKRDRYHAELTRLPPDHLADMICKLREENTALVTIINATAIHRDIQPIDYLKALSHCYFVAHGKPTTNQETPSRAIPASRAPAHNPEAHRIWRAEYNTLHSRTPFLLTATETAIRHPHGRKQVTRTPHKPNQPSNHAA